MLKESPRRVCLGLGLPVTLHNLVMAAGIAALSRLANMPNRSAYLCWSIHAEVLHSVNL